MQQDEFSNMNFEFRYREYAEALYLALHEDAFYIAMESAIDDEGSPKEAMLRYLEFSMIEGQRYGELYIPKDHEYGVSVWAKPLSSKLEAQKLNEKKQFLYNMMGDESLKTYNTIVDFMSSKAEPLIDKKSWYLSIIGVLPQFQGQGLGRELVKNVLEKTDSLKVPTYLETFTPRNITFYNRLGYQEIESFHEPTTDAKYWLMIREPANV